MDKSPLLPISKTSITLRKTRITMSKHLLLYWQKQLSKMQRKRIPKNHKWMLHHATQNKKSKNGRKMENNMEILLSPINHIHHQKLQQTHFQTTKPNKSKYKTKAIRQKTLRHKGKRKQKVRKQWRVAFASAPNEAQKPNVTPKREEPYTARK
jgi:hypothetical protein